MPSKRSLLLATGLALLLQGAHAAPADTGASRPDASAELAPDTVILELPLAAGEPPLHATLKQAMDALRVPGLSIALIDDYRIAWARGYGVTAPGGRRPVTPGTLFQAASISKPVAAAGGLWLVDHGRLTLDGDVNASLVTWKVPENQFTRTEKVTLRRLMSHNAGVNVHGFAGYEKGTPIPTLTQTLDGEKPANHPPIRVDTVPGTRCRYSGGGVTIEGLLIQDVSGQAFEDFMRDRVLVPAGMRDSTFRQDLPPALAARAATGTRADGAAVPGGWHVYPELAPDGLWTTPSDLARFAIEIALSKQGKANHVLSRALTREMLSVQCEDDNDRVGLGFGVGFPAHPDLFRHTGGNDGFESVLMMFADKGYGIAAMGNSDAFMTVADLAIARLSKDRGWGYAAPLNLSDIMTIVRSIRGTRAALDMYARAKADGFAGYRHGSDTLNTFGYGLLRDKRYAEAIAVMRLNVAAYPQDANAYDSLAEAYRDAGEKALAIRNYETSLRMNPQNDNAKVQLDKLRR